MAPRARLSEGENVRVCRGYPRWQSAAINFATAIRFQPTRRQFLRSCRRPTSHSASPTPARDAHTVTAIRPGIPMRSGTTSAGGNGRDWYRHRSFSNVMAKSHAKPRNGPDASSETSFDAWLTHGPVRQRTCEHREGECKWPPTPTAEGQW